jgi:5'-nucleotidase
MHILVTNDDGINAPGLLALAQAMRDLGRVTVVAPDHNWSASGHVKTFHRPIRVRETVLADGSKAYHSDGAPSDCIAVALLGFVKPRVDLVVSGINPSANIGHDVTYSGTVTAAMEGAIAGVPSMAVSQDSPEFHDGKLDYSTSARVAREVAAAVMKNNLPEGIFINLNIPYLPYESIKGFCITRQGIRLYHDVLVRRKDPRGKPYYWIGGPAPTGVREKDTDYGAIKSGYVSITPLELDLTAASAIKTMKTWKFINKKSS